MMTKIPNLFIVGAAKAGTTTIYDYLNLHPEVYMSPIKEPHFFSKDINPINFIDLYKKRVTFDIDDYFNKNILQLKHIAHINKLDNYLKLFNKVINEKIIGEASTGYLYSNVAAEEIKKYNPAAKIIIVLRDPFERILSHYYADVSTGIQEDKNPLITIKSDYNEKIKGWGITNLYIELSQYKEQVERYYKLFNPNQIQVLDFKELQTMPNLFFGKITNFLGIKHFTPNKNLASNQTYIPKNKLASHMHSFYRKHLKDSKIHSLIHLKALKYFFLKKPDRISPHLLEQEFTDLLSTEVEYYKFITQKEIEL